MRLEQDPIHTHKDVLAHTIAVVANTPPLCGSGSPRCSTTSASPRPARSGRAGELPPPRGRRRAHGRRAHARAQVPERPRGPGHEARVPAPAHPHLCDGLDRQGGAPVRARRGRSARRPQRAAALRLHDAQQAQGRVARAPHGRARGAHRAAARAGGARRDQAAARRPRGHGAPRRPAGPRDRRSARLPARSCASTKAR